MRVLGVDFTSSPSRRKPIAAAWCRLEEAGLLVDSVELLPSFEAFEGLLQMPGPWIGGFDLPFAQPKEFGKHLNAETWIDCMKGLREYERPTFVSQVRAFMSARNPGNKRPARYVDRLAGSASSLNVVRPPVAKMFLEGARRLLESGVCIQPCHRNHDTRVALEAYPKLVTRCLGVVAYKSDRGKTSEEHRRARSQIIEAFGDGRIHAHYGFHVLVPEELKPRLLDDESGDQLDAVLCAIQAAWASRLPNHGIPVNCDCDEGWIVDPAVLDKHFR